MHGRQNDLVDLGLQSLAGLDNGEATRRARPSSGLLETFGNMAYRGRHVVLAGTLVYKIRQAGAVAADPQNSGKPVACDGALGFFFVKIEVLRRCAGEQFSNIVRVMWM